MTSMPDKISDEERYHKRYDNSNQKLKNKHDTFRYDKIPTFLGVGILLV